MRGGYPSKPQRSVVGCASEGSACLREAASAKAGPTKHVEEPRLRAVTPAYRRQALRRAGTGFSPWGSTPGAETGWSGLGFIKSVVFWVVAWWCDRIKPTRYRAWRKANSKFILASLAKMCYILQTMCHMDKIKEEVRT